MYVWRPKRWEMESGHHPPENLCLPTSQKYREVLTPTPLFQAHFSPHTYLPPASCPFEEWANPNFPSLPLPLLLSKCARIEVTKPRILLYPFLKRSRREVSRFKQILRRRAKGKGEVWGGQWPRSTCLQPAPCSELGNSQTSLCWPKSCSQIAKKTF